MKLQNVEIKRPDEQTLNAWIEHLSACTELKITPELMLQAYYFDCAFILGRFPDDPQETIDLFYHESDGSFYKTLGTAARGGLSDAICYIKLGIRHPKYGDKEKFQKEFESRLKESDLI